MNIKPPNPSVEKRPWGEELWVSDSSPTMVKIITVYVDQALSLQYHHERDEYWRVLSGNGTAIIGDDKIALMAGSNCFIPRETKHRLIGGSENLVLLELAFGNFDENDIVRLEDRYGRVPPQTGQTL